MYVNLKKLFIKWDEKSAGDKINRDENFVFRQRRPCWITRLGQSWSHLLIRTFFSRINSSFYVKTPLTRINSSLYSIDNRVCWPRVEHTTTGTILRDWPIRSRSEHWKRTTGKNNNESKLYKTRVYLTEKYIMQLNSVFTMKRI